jgi:hypothetical protein
LKCAAEKIDRVGTSIKSNYLKRVLRFVDFKCIILMLLICISFSCQKGKCTAVYDHHVYIWQRTWTSSLDSSIIRSHTTFAVMHILVSEMERNGRITDVNPDYAFLIANRISIIPVYRIDGRIADSSWSSVIKHIVTVNKNITEKNVAIQGIEIDYDCASSRLDRYSTVLHSIRQSIDTNVTLSITALPSWMENLNLYRVLKEVNFSVLQVHSVVGPQSGIFNSKFAFDNIIRYSSISPVSFRVALPAYSSLIQFDKAGKIIAVENEVVYPMENRSEAREYGADPVVVRGLIDKVSKKPVAKLTGFVWFRLPVVEDNRSWGLRTLLAVVNNHKLFTQLEIISCKRDGIFNLEVKNKGSIDGMVMSIDVRVVNSSIEEPLSSFVIEKRRSFTGFTLRSPLKIKAGHTVPVGWIKCDSIKELRIHGCK